MTELATVIVWDITGSTKWLIHHKQGVNELIECFKDICQQSEWFGFDLLVPRGDGALLVREEICPELAVIASKAMYESFCGKYKSRGFLRVAISGGQVVYATVSKNMLRVPFGVPIYQACRLCDWAPRDGHVIVISQNFLLRVNTLLECVDSKRTIELPAFPEPYNKGYCFMLD